MSRRACAALLLLAPSLLLLCPTPAGAGPLTVRAADGSTWHVNEDDETRLERRGADGKLDTRFGKGGLADYTLGHADAGTAAMRVDAAGRIWVAGTSSAQGTSGPVVMRFLPDGRPDPAWGVAGRSSATPPGQRLVVTDLLPLPDGSVWLAGNALASPAGQHAAIWRLKPDGSLDFKLGAGGIWQRPGRDRTEAISLAESPDGSVAFGLEGPEAGKTLREIYLLQAGDAAPQPGERSVSDDDDEDDDYLEWAGQAWRWGSGEQVVGVSGLAAAAAAAVEAADPAGSDGSDAGKVALSPFGVASAPPPAELPPEERPWGLMLAGAAAVLGLLALWARRAWNERGQKRDPPRGGRQG